MGLWSKATLSPVRVGRRAQGVPLSPHPPPPPVSPAGVEYVFYVSGEDRARLQRPSAALAMTERMRDLPGVQTLTLQRSAWRARMRWLIRPSARTDPVSGLTRGLHAASSSCGGAQSGSGTSRAGRGLGESAAVRPPPAKGRPTRPWPRRGLDWTPWRSTTLQRCFTRCALPALPPLRPGAAVAGGGRSLTHTRVGAALGLDGDQDQPQGPPPATHSGHRPLQDLQPVRG